MANKNDTKRIKVVEVFMRQGNLYEVHGEDSVYHVFDCTIGCRTADGREWTHNGFRVKGFVTDPESGINHPNRNYRAEGLIITEMVHRFGDINPELWTQHKEPSFQEREAYNIRCEQDEREQEGY